MIGTLRRANRVANRHATSIFLAGLLGVAWHNWRLWQNDQALLATMSVHNPLPPLEGSTALPRVSVLVAAWNEGTTIDRHVQSFLALRYPNRELILCAGGADGTSARASRWVGPRVTVLEQQPGEGKQGALQRCLEGATGDIIFLTDADCFLDDQSFERTLGPILRGEAEAATGGSRPPLEQLMEPNASSLVAYRWSADAYALARSPGEAAGLLGRNAAVTRRALERAGGLAADVPTGTDYHLAKCLLERGVRIRHVRESWVTTRYPENLRAYARQQRRWLKNVVVLGRRFGAYREMAAAARTSVIGLGMLLTPALVWLVGGWILSLWLVAVAHSAVSKVRYLAFASLLHERFDRRLLFRSVWWVVPLTFVEFGIWASALADYLIPRRRTLW